MMGEKLLELDPEPELLEAFACFDEGDKGYVSVNEMRKYLGELGDRMSDAEVISPSDELSDSSPCLDHEAIQRSEYRPTRPLQLCGVCQGAESQRWRGSAARSSGSVDTK